MLIAGGGGGSSSSASWWPGLDVPADTQEMDPDAVRELADELQGVLDDLTGRSPGSWNHVNEKATAAASGQNGSAFGLWDLGVQMHETYIDAHDKIMGCYSELIGQLQAAIQTLRVEVGDLEATDQGSMIQGDVPPTSYAGAPASDVVVQPGMSV